MKLALSMATVALISGCASYSQLRDRDPAISIESAKSAEEYLGCITPAFAEIWPTTTNLRDGDLWIVAVPHGVSYLATVTIRPNQHGAVAEYRQLNNITKFAFGRAREAVRSCA